MRQVLYINKPHNPGLYLFNSLVLLLIIFLQFQNILAVPIRESQPGLSHVISLIDKILLVCLFSMFFYVRFLTSLFTIDRYTAKTKSYIITLIPNERPLLICLVTFIFYCLLSGFINQNELLVSLNGTFVYVVYFGVFFIFSSLPYTESIIKKDYSFLLKLALFLSVVSIVQELLAFTYPASIAWWPNIQKEHALWRMGLFRAPSLLGHPNTIGVFVLFFWTTEMARIKREGLRNGWLKIVLLGLALLFSVSRCVIGAALIALFLLPHGRKLFYLILPAVIIVAIFPSRLLEVAERHAPASIVSYDEYRKFALEKSLDVFKDHPLWGVGPGMYGGHISLKYDSPIYRQYGFSGRNYRHLHNKVASIEQQWLQVLAELGILGAFLFILLLLSPILILYRLSTKNNDSLTKALISGFMVMPLQMCFLGIGFTVTNKGAWLIPYFTFVGMLVGTERSKKID